MAHPSRSSIVGKKRFLIVYLVSNGFYNELAWTPTDTQIKFPVLYLEIEWVLLLRRDPSLIPHFGDANSIGMRKGKKNQNYAEISSSPHPLSSLARSRKSADTQSQSIRRSCSSVHVISRQENYPVLSSRGLHFGGRELHPRCRRRTVLSRTCNSLFYTWGTSEIYYYARNDLRIRSMFKPNRLSQVNRRTDEKHLNYAELSLSAPINVIHT